MPVFPDANINDTLDLFEYANTVTDSAFWDLSLVSVWFVMFASLAARYNLEDSFAASSFITMILSLILMATGLISERIIIGTITATVVSIIFMIVRR